MQIVYLHKNIKKAAKQISEVEKALAWMNEMSDKKSYKKYKDRLDALGITESEFLLAMKTKPGK